MADPDLRAALQKALADRAASGGAQQGPQPIVPMWKVRPKATSERVNVGQFGDVRTEDGGRVTAGRPRVDFPYTYVTPTVAGSSFLDMEQKDRDEFQEFAIRAGLIKPGQDGIVTQAEVFNAWQAASEYAAKFNGERDKDKWISPWEAVNRLALSNKAADGSVYDPFAPKTNRQTTKRDFTSGADAESITRTLESLFQSEMGRAPTQEERAIYQRLVQKAYDKNPEVTTTTSQTDAQGNTTGTSTRTGGIDETATLLDQVRSDPEHAAFQAGSTYFEAAMAALGAIA